MKTRLIKFFSALVITVFLVGFPAKIRADEVSEMVAKPYTGQRSMECHGITRNIPEFFPHSRDNLFIHFSKDQCTQTYFEISIDISSDCSRIHACHQYSFSQSSIKTGPNDTKILDENIAAPDLGSAIIAGMRVVALDKQITGYIIPSRLYAYPTPLQIIWADENYLYEIRQNGGDEEALIKSANSMIDIP